MSRPVKTLLPGGDRRLDTAEALCYDATIPPRNSHSDRNRIGAPTDDRSECPGQALLISECLWNRQPWCCPSLGGCCLFDDELMVDLAGEEDPF